MSCPASIAFSICGTTDSSKPMMPGKSSSPRSIFPIRLCRISSLTLAAS